jgi:DMSO/TMAO reductase YedYZ molybdopterin-dependent catalytic subunit
MDRSKPRYVHGILSGLVAALVLFASELILRTAFGIGTIAELASDRIAPLTGIPLFFKLLNSLGGYSHLKELGIVATFLAELAGGAAVGLLYAKLLKMATAGRARAATSGVVAFLLLVTIAGLWPNLGTNYHGLPPSKALIVSVLKMLGVTALFVAALVWVDGMLEDVEGTESDGRRRSFTIGAVATAAMAVSAGLLARFYAIAAYSYDGTENTGDDLPPVTPNDKFYQVTKNNVDPRPSLSDWAMELGGSVARPAVLHLSDLQAMHPVLQETTLQCISNQIGGGLNSNANWKGVPLKDILERAGASPGAKQVMFHGADGFIDDIPFEKAMDPNTLLVFEMNGVPLPHRHGFPVRMIVPGYVGEKSVKWLTKIEVREKPAQGFYEQQGWGPQFTINNSSRFDTKFDKPLHIGQRTVIKGTAFAGDRGVKQVEVSTDNEKTWQSAEITYRGSDLVWVQWRFPWQPTTLGEVTLSVRCVDNQGGTQSGVDKGPAPNPATGYHHMKAKVLA